MRAAVSVLADAGARVDEVDSGFADPVQAFHVLSFSGEAKALEPYGDTVDDRVDPGLRRTAAVGSTYSASDYLDAVAVRMRLGQLMGQFHQTYDVLVTPSLPLPAFAAGQDVPDALRRRRTGPARRPTLSVQPDPAAGAERALRVDLGRSADRAGIVGPRHADALSAAGGPGV